MDDDNSLTVARTHAANALGHARALSDPDQRRSWTELACAWLALIEALQQFERRLTGEAKPEKTD